MFKTFKNALKVKEIRQKLLYTFIMMVIVRIGCQLPIPGTSQSAIQSVMGSLAASDAYSFFSAFTGGSLEKMSVFALSITPYITSSIIMQLLTIAIPKLEEMQNEGESGRKKIQEITRYVTVALAVVESISKLTGVKINFADGSKEDIQGEIDKHILMAYEAKNFYDFINSIFIDAKIFENIFFFNA